jgi:hypothetical protein
MMNLVIWNVTASTTVGNYHRFREVSCIHLQDNSTVQILTSLKTLIKTLISLFFLNEFLQRQYIYAFRHVQFPLCIILVMKT